MSDTHTHTQTHTHRMMAFDSDSIARQQLNKINTANQTSVSETISNGAARRSPNCIRKTTNTFCGMRVSFPLPKFCEKLLRHAKFHWNRAIGCWVMAKRIFNMAVVRPPFWIIKKIHIWSCDCHRVPKLLLCSIFHHHRTMFLLTYADLNFQHGGRSPSWIFEI